MEDNSYVSLSLEKYNELYDKARKYDEMENEETEEPKIGDKVCVIGTLIQHNGSGIAYKIKFDDAHRDWFTKDQVKKNK